jgi:succinoglycan biosynthesis protein ExoA
MIISIICPCYNEEKYIEATLDSFLQQQCENFEVEILICDGMSTDGTRTIVQSYASKYPSIRLIDNVKRKTPFAFNVGLAAAKGDYVAILGAHSAYKSNYIQACYDALLQHNAIACTGRVITQAAFDTATAKLSEWVMLSSFGVSGNSFRVMKEGYVHSVNFPVVKKEALLDLGGYDESLERNQDNDMNQRLLDAGHQLYCTWNTTAYYRPPASVKKLLQYAFRGGFWNAKSFYTHRKSMRWHHFIPFVFTSTICLLLLAIVAELILLPTFFASLFLLFLVALHLAAGTVATIRSLLYENHPLKIFLPLIFFAFHFSYGWGSLNGFVKKSH